LAAGFYPKNLLFARKMALPDLGGGATPQPSPACMPVWPVFIEDKIVTFNLSDTLSVIQECKPLAWQKVTAA